MSVVAERTHHEASTPAPAWWQFEGVTRSGDTGHWAAADRVERAVAVGVFLLTVAFVPGLSVGPWTAEVAVALVLGMAGVPLLVHRALGGGDGPVTQRWAARALLAWIAVGLASALHSARPALSLMGWEGVSEGWWLMVVAGGCWALGSRLRAPGRSLVASALVAGGVVNGLVGFGQVVGGLSGFGLPPAAGLQALGLQANPVFLGAVGAAGAAVVASRFRSDGRQRALLVATLAATVGVSSERLSMLVVLAIVAWVPVASWLDGRGLLIALRRSWSAGGAAGEHAPGLRSSVQFAGAAAAGLVVGILMPLVKGRLEVGAKLATSAEGTFGDRLHAWLAGLHALMAAPLLGAGPGSFQAATERYFPLWFVRTHPNQFFSDGHNLFVEYAVTTGLLGLASLVTWLVLAAGRPAGAWLAVAAVLGMVAMAEPLNPVTTPLLFLAVGGAAGAGRARGGVPSRVAEFNRTRRLLAVGTVVSLVAGVGAASGLVVGTWALSAANSTRQLSNEAAARAHARLADELLGPWPQPTEELADIALLSSAAPGAGPRRSPLAQAARLEEEAAQKNPADPVTWADAAVLRLQLGQLGRAARDARASVADEPWEVPALQVLGTVAMQQGHQAQGRRWFQKVVLVRPRPTLQQLLDGVCNGAPGGASFLTRLRRCG